ncbi:MAG: anti-sigma factor, partial [Flavobacteriaceae bacterium]|nr:anti-sigma factor [Flavobacteriaceae bacterium]
MIDKSNIKESGLLEQYLLGELSIEQTAEVEAILDQDQDLLDYVRTIENNLEKIAFDHAIAPPHEVKENLLASLTPEKKKSGTSFYRYAVGFAALFFIFTSIWLYNDSQRRQKEVDLTKQEIEILKNELEALQAQNDDNMRFATILKDKNTIPFIVKGNDKVAFQSPIAYVNHVNKEVFVNPKQLPKLSSEKTYQMWGDVDGEMINMGLLNPQKDMIVMSYIENATSINITIEPAGGNDHATVENLVANVFL